MEERAKAVPAHLKLVQVDSTRLASINAVVRYSVVVIERLSLPLQLLQVMSFHIRYRLAFPSYINITTCRRRIDSRTRIGCFALPFAFAAHKVVGDFYFY